MPLKRLLTAALFAGLLLPAAAQPADFDAWFDRGRALLDSGRPEESRQALLKAQALRPGDDRVYPMLGAADAALGRFDEAVRDFEAALRSHPRDYWLRMQLARSYIGSGRLDLARKTFSSARKIDPRQRDSYIEEGYMDLDAGQGERAERDLRNLIAVDSTSPAGYHHLASILSFEGRSGEAEPYFREAMDRFAAQAHPDEEDRLHTLAWLGDNALARNKPDDAEAYDQEGLRDAAAHRDFQAKFLMSLGSVYETRGSSAAAEDYYARSTAICGDESDCPSYGPQAFMALGGFDFAQGRRSEAHRAADRASELLAKAALASLLNGNCIQEFAMLGDLYWNLGDAALAVKAYGRLLPLEKIAPSSPSLASADVGLARIDEAQGRRDQAADLYRRAAEIWRKDGRLDKAREARGKAEALARIQGK